MRRREAMGGLSRPSSRKPAIVRDRPLLRVRPHFSSTPLLAQSTFPRPTPPTPSSPTIGGDRRRKSGTSGDLAQLVRAYA